MDNCDTLIPCGMSERKAKLIFCDFGIVRRWLWFKKVVGIVGIEGGFGSGAWYRKVALVQEGDGCLQINGEIRLSVLRHLNPTVVCIKSHSCVQCLLNSSVF